MLSFNQTTSPIHESETRKLCLTLRSSFSPEDWKNFESSLTPIRLGYFLGNEQVKSLAHDILSRHPSKKDKTKAMSLKNLGNKAFGSGNNAKAVEHYTAALAWVPHDDGSTDAAILYANRSAAYFHNDQISLAERDARLAFELGYPNDLHYKLHQRLASCYSQLGRNSEAMKSLEKAFESLSHASGLDETKLEKTKAGLETLKSRLTKLSSAGNEKAASLGATESGRIPEVIGGPSKYLKACSKGLVMKQNEKKGRFIVASEAFNPGDILLVEKAFVSVLLPQHYHRQCFQCYQPMEAPILCKSCINASYCSTDCRDKSQRTHHQFECNILGALKYSGISVICYMALRVLTQSSPSKVLQWYNLVAPKKENLKQISGDVSTMEYKADHTSFFSLVTHWDRRKSESDFHQIIMTSYLLNILKSTDYLRKVKGETNVAAGEVELKVGLVLHYILQLLQFNTHETAGWDPDLPKDNSVGLGGGVFPTLAMFNHSCNPALVRYFINDTVVVRAIRSIRPGEEVTENYGPCYITMGKKERQRVLREQFWFECDCIPCLEDWPTFDKMTLSMDGARFRCDKCGAFICSVDENMGLLFKCGRCSHSVNILKSLKALQDSEQKFKQALEFIDNGDESNGMGILLENIALLDKHLMPPLKDMHVCQEHVRKCLLNIGNKISKLPALEPEKV